MSQGKRHPFLARYYLILLVCGWIAIAILPLGAQDSYNAALSLFWDGRRLEMAETRQAESQLAFQRSLAMTDRLLAADPSNPDLQTLKTWNLFRLHRYVDTVVYAQSVLNTRHSSIRMRKLFRPSAAILQLPPKATTDAPVLIIMLEKFILG